jgi:hypothetical protein
MTPLVEPNCRADILDVVYEFVHRGEAARWDHILGQITEEPLDEIKPRLEELVLRRVPSTIALNGLAEIARRPWAEQKSAIFC